MTKSPFLRGPFLARARLAAIGCCPDGITRRRFCRECDLELLRSSEVREHWTLGWCSQCFTEFLVPWPEGWQNANT